MINLFSSTRGHLHAPSEPKVTSTSATLLQSMKFLSAFGQVVDEEDLSDQGSSVRLSLYLLFDMRRRNKNTAYFYGNLKCGTMWNNPCLAVLDISDLVNISMSSEGLTRLRRRQFSFLVISLLIAHIS